MLENLPQLGNVHFLDNDLEVRGEVSTQDGMIVAYGKDRDECVQKLRDKLCQAPMSM